MEPVDEAFVRQMGSAIGPSSASFGVMNELADRRARGENVSLFASRCRLLVLPSDAVAGTGLQLLDEAFVQRILCAIGPSSASFRVLNELRQRRARGENVSLFASGRRLLVLSRRTD